MWEVVAENGTLPITFPAILTACRCTLSPGHSLDLLIDQAQGTQVMMKMMKKLLMMTRMMTMAMQMERVNLVLTAGVSTGTCALC